MKRLIALVVSGIALAACASPTEPVATATSNDVSAKKSLVGASRAQATVSTRIAFN